MRVRGYELTYPRLLLAALVVVVISSGFVGLTTSETAFGSYNPAWDGASEVRTLAANTGAQTEIVRETSAYTGQSGSGTTALVVSPTEAYSDRDSERIAAFVRGGGTLVVASDFDDQTNPLLADLGVTARFDGRLIRDERRYYRSPALAVAPNVNDTEVTADVSRLTLNHGTAIDTGANSTIVVNTSGYAYFDTNRNGALDDAEELAERPVVVRESVGEGTVVAVSDPSIFINSMLDVSDNRAFARNLVSDETVLFDYSHRSGIPPVVAVVLTIADSPLLQFLSITVLVGISAALWRSNRIPLPWTESSSPEIGDVGPSETELLDRVTARHPEWDESRVERVARGIMPDAPKEDEDD
jgi:hypothetical protein